MAESELQTLRGTVVRVTFHTEETGYCVLKVMPSGRRSEETLIGSAPRVVAGETFVAEGNWVQDRVHGRQFKSTSLRLTPPDSAEGLVRYLGSGLIDGIGPKYAERMVAKFGDRIYDIIENESAKLESVEGIGTKRRKEIKESWTKQKSVHAIMLFLHQHGIGTARALRIYKTYGASALDVLRRDPYRLAAEIRGIGFKSADEIAMKMGIATDATERLKAGLLHTLDEAAQKGHCYLPESQLTVQAAEILHCDAANLAAPLAQLKAEDKVTQKAQHIYLHHLHTAEQRIATHLIALASTPPSYPQMGTPAAVQDGTSTLSESQKTCLLTVLTSRVNVITGGPGVGKTTILKSLLGLLRSHEFKIVLAAPTGRAAKRMSESTGLHAGTLHRLLEFQGDGQWGRNSSRPLVGDLFVLDECSMVDALLMAQFLGALPLSAHLLLVGDIDQLPSVGPGSVLADIIASGTVPCHRLTEIFRQAAGSRIITSAHEINSGRIPDLRPTRESDFFFLQADTPEAVAATLTGLIATRLPARYGFDPFTDIQLLTPMNRGPLGTHALNHALQLALNPPNEFKMELDRFGSTFRTGDKVIQTTNNYDKDVFNGDLGIISRIETDPLKIVVRYDGARLVEYEPGELDELRLAYALTIHKSQGSEFPCVILPLSTQHYIMLERSLLYTGVTRGRKLVILVGDERSLQLAVKNQNTRKRFTGLTAALVSQGKTSAAPE